MVNERIDEPELKIYSRINYCATFFPLPYLEKFVEKKEWRIADAWTRKWIFFVKGEEWTKRTRLERERKWTNFARRGEGSVHEWRKRRQIKIKFRSETVGAKELVQILSVKEMKVN
jgi:hypothetical protein